MVRAALLALRVAVEVAPVCEHPCMERLSPSMSHQCPMRPALLRVLIRLMPLTVPGQQPLPAVRQLSGLLVVLVVLLLLLTTLEIPPLVWQHRLLSMATGVQMVA